VGGRGFEGAGAEAGGAVGLDGEREQAGGDERGEQRPREVGARGERVAALIDDGGVGEQERGVHAVDGLAQPDVGGVRAGLRGVPARAALGGEGVADGLMG
jgi:hypothetical protein